MLKPIPMNTVAPPSKTKEIPEGRCAATLIQKGTKYKPLQSITSETLNFDIIVNPQFLKGTN